MNYQNIQQLLDADRPEEALAEADKIIALDENDGMAHFLRGKALWRLGNRVQATNAYAVAAEILGPESPPGIALRHAADIENFFNPDLLNP